MFERKFKLLDNDGHVVARDMDLETACLLIKAWVNAYYADPWSAAITIMEDIDDKSTSENL